MNPKSAVSFSVLTDASAAGGLFLFSSAGDAQSSASEESGATRYLPEYTANGELILPKKWRHWVFVGSPLTPNGLNDGKANFPSFTINTSSRARLRFTRRRANSRREQFSSKN